MGDGKDPAKVLDIKTADIKRAAPDFQTAAVDLGKALTALVKSSTGWASPGERQAGQGVRRLLQAAAEEDRGAAGTLVLGLTSIHEAMADMADGHVDNDELIAGMFTEVKVPKTDGAGER